MADKAATRDGYGNGLMKLGESNPQVVVLDADLWTSTRTEQFRKTWPERFIDAGICEQDMVGVAAGLAVEGFIPFASSFACFMSRGWEQVRVSVAIPALNVKLGATHAGITVGDDGASAQMTEDFALMRSLPNMVVVCPCDVVEAEQATLAAAAHHGPVYLRFGRERVPTITAPGDPFVLGQARPLREGGDVTIAATGIMVSAALEAVEALAGDGIEAALLDFHTIKPLDQDALLASAGRTRAVVTAEEHQVMGGLGSAVAEVLVKHLPLPVEMVGMQDVFGESGTPAQLLRKYGQTPGDIVAAAHRAIARK